MSKRKGLAFLTVAAGAVTAFVLGRRRHRRKQTTGAEVPTETAEEVPPGTEPEDEGATQIP